MVKRAKIVIVLIITVMAIIFVGNSSVWARVDQFRFKDLKGSWAAEEINYLALKEIVQGAEDGSFHPKEVITRAEFIKLLVKALGLTEGTMTNLTFQDVNPRVWYSPFVKSAMAAGLIRGSGESFWPEKAISREEGAVILVRALGQEQEAQSLVHGQIHALLLKYPDQEGASSWADEYLALAVREHLITGQPGRALEPLAQLTREEAAVLIVRLMLSLKSIPA